jgi:iron complex outermembrane recepter protein
MRRIVHQRKLSKTRSVQGLCVAGLASALPMYAAAQEAQSTGATDELAEVIVTAERRAERELDVPISVTALDAAALEASGVTDTRQLTAVTPGVVIDTFGGFTQPAIRGVSSVGTAPGNESNVATYIDGIYSPNQTANTVDLPDASNVQILKGPQGTLFGRNATGGAILVTTLDPTFEPYGKFSVGYGRFQDDTATAIISGPLSGDTLAGSFTAYYEGNEGWDNDVLRGGHIGAQNNLIFRGKLLWKLSDDARFVLTAYRNQRDDQSNLADQSLNGNTVAATFTPKPILPTQPYQIALNFDPYERVETTGASLRGEFNIAGGTLTSITAGSHTIVPFGFDGDQSSDTNLYYNIWQPDSNISQEVTYASAKYGRVNYVAGIFLYYDQSSWDPLRINSSQDVDFGQETKSAAAFGELYYDLTNNLSAIAGGRYSYEYKYATGAVGPAGNPGPYILSASHSWDNFSPRVSLKYRFSPDVNAYLTYSEGFKSGSFDSGTLSPVPVNPERLNAVELGLKAELNNRLQVSGAIYDYDYMNQQVQVENGDLSVLENAANAHIYGLDLEMTALVVTDFRIRSGLSLLHAFYSAYNNATFIVPVAGGGNEDIIANATGRDEIRSPRWTLTLSPEYSHQFAAGRFALSATGYHTDRYFYDAQNRVTQPSYTTLSALASFTPQNSKFTFSIWGRNLTNQVYYQSVLISTASDGVSYAPPRTYGIRATYEY